MARLPKRWTAGFFAGFLLLIQVEAAFAIHACPFHAMGGDGHHDAAHHAAPGPSGHHARGDPDPVDDAGYGHSGDGTTSPAALRGAHGSHPTHGRPAARGTRSAHETHAAHETAPAHAAYEAPAVPGHAPCPVCDAAPRAEPAADHAAHGAPSTSHDGPCDCIGTCHASASTPAPVTIVVWVAERPVTAVRPAFEDDGVAGPWLPPHFLPYALAPPASA